jgi:hypothetical protein
MKNLTATIRAVFVVCTLSSTIASPAEATAQSLENLVAEADLIALVEILSTDYTATAADGPMYGEARVLRVVKGRFASSQPIRFGASAWVGPTYKKGQQRIVFFHRVPANHPYYQKARWSSMETGKLDLYFATSAFEECTEASLRNFLRRLQGAAPPKMSMMLTRRAANILTLSIKLVNDTHLPLWLNLRRMGFSFEAGGVRYSRAVQWGHQEDWFPLKPGLTLSGVAIIRADEIKSTDEMTVILSHLSVRFPQRSWVGFQSAKVRLRDQSWPVQF